jgi:tRNA A37 threonylcarbamoyltransferase TsaD
MSIARVSRIAASSAPAMRRADDVAATKAPGMALVPLQGAAQAGSTSLHLNRPDASFVTHLIATAQHIPQTRILRRAAIADVQAAYRSVANQNEKEGWSSGVRLRLTA